MVPLALMGQGAAFDADSRPAGGTVWGWGAPQDAEPGVRCWLDDGRWAHRPVHQGAVLVAASYGAGTPSAMMLLR